MPRVIQYSYIAKPTREQTAEFLRQLESNGISISHLGKNDPPRKFSDSIDAATELVFSGKDMTNYTFARNSKKKLDFSFEIHHDPRWINSTISASCENLPQLEILAKCVIGAFNSFITIRGVSGAGKNQAWDVIHLAEDCPPTLRSQFSAA